MGVGEPAHCGSRMMAGKNILVTGGAGFIGSHLVERLLGEGASVTVVDDLSTGSKANLSNVGGAASLRVIDHSVSDWDELGEVVKGSDFVFHLASVVGVELVVKSPINTIHTNLHVTEAVLDVAAEASVPVLLTSTSEVYGKSQNETFSESDDLLIGPPHLGRWSYACSKLMDEFLAMAYWQDRKSPVVIARLFNTVGPRQTGKYGMVLPRFIESAMRGEPLVVFGDGSQSRCFCFVGDTVEALVRLSASETSYGEVFNVGSDEEVTILELASRVREIVGSESEIVFKPYVEAYSPGFEDMQRRRPAVGKLEAATAFRPTTDLTTIIKLTAESMSDSLV